MVVEIAGRDGDGVLMLVHHPVPLCGGGEKSGDEYMYGVRAPAELLDCQAPTLVSRCLVIPGWQPFYKS